MIDMTEFWSRVDKSGDCWIWRGAPTKNGYGKITRAGRTQYAHRVAYAATHGPIPEGGLIDHRCHVKLCVRPAHLQAVDNSGNMQNRQGAQKNSRSGIRGVYWQQGKWRVQIRAGGRNHSGGVYTDLDEARAAASRLRASLMPNSLRDLEAAS